MEARALFELCSKMRRLTGVLEGISCSKPDELHDPESKQ